MRRAVPVLTLAVLLAGPALAADRGTMERKDGLRDAVTAPLEDLNLKRVDIPDVLTRAVANPYDLAAMSRCEGIAGEVGRLDAVLGPDLDEAPPPDPRSRGRKAADAAWDAGVGEVRDTTRDVLPFRGWIRRLTGAAKHDRAVQAAIRAGGVRRGYLKGMGMRMNCAPPAAPSWFVPAPPPKPPAPPSPMARVTGFWDGVVNWWRSWWPF
jgi:hypothetical protein